MNIIKAMKLWIKLLENAKHHMSAIGAPIADVLDAIDQVNKAIAELENKQPVAWQNTEKHDDLVSAEDWSNIDPMWHWMYQPLYTHPQPKAEQEPKREWVGLTDEEIKGITLASGDSIFSAIMFTHDKLKEKNT